MRTAGRVMMVGVLIDEPFPISAGNVFLRGLSVLGMVGEPLRYRDDLLRLVGAGRIDPASVISHRLPLAASAEAYRMFDAREATKIVLAP